MTAMVKQYLVDKWGNYYEDVIQQFRNSEYSSSLLSLFGSKQAIPAFYFRLDPKRQEWFITIPSSTNSTPGRLYLTSPYYEAAKWNYVA